MLLKLTNFFFNFLSKNDKNSRFFQENTLGFFHHFIWVFSFLIYPNSQVLFFPFFILIFVIFHLPWQALRFCISSCILFYTSSGTSFLFCCTASAKDFRQISLLLDICHNLCKYHH